MTSRKGGASWPMSQLTFVPLLALMFVGGRILAAQESPISTSVNAGSSSSSTPNAGGVETDIATANNAAHPLKSGTPYLVGIDDVLAVSVWHEPDLSRSISVRPDGKISLPLVGEIQASGKSVLELQHEIRLGLANFVKDPEVVVIVTEIRSQRINVIGQVARAGAFSLTQSMGVLDAIALAGGLKEFAKQKQIYVLRITASGQRQRLSYSYADVLKGNKSAKEIILEPRDTVVVP